MPLQGSISPTFSTAIKHSDPKSTKNTIMRSVFFALLGSAPVKAAHNMLVKLTPGRERKVEERGRERKVRKRGIKVEVRERVSKREGEGEQKK